MFTSIDTHMGMVLEYLSHLRRSLLIENSVSVERVPEIAIISGLQWLYFLNLSKAKIQCKITRIRLHIWPTSIHKSNVTARNLHFPTIFSSKTVFDSTTHDYHIFQKSDFYSFRNLKYVSSEKACYRG